MSRSWCVLLSVIGLPLIKKEAGNFKLKDRWINLLELKKKFQ